MSGSILTVLDAEALRGIVAEELGRQLGPLLRQLSEPATREPQSEPSQWMLSRAELARMLGVNARTLRRMVLAGELPEPIKVGKRAVRWERSAVDRWLADRR